MITGARLLFTLLGFMTCLAFPPLAMLAMLGSGGWLIYKATRKCK